MTTITLSHYTRGKYLGTDDKTVAWSVLYNGSPITAEQDEAPARQTAEREYLKAPGPKQLVEWDGDTATQKVILEKKETR